MTDEKDLGHISDTARWVATYRAWETKRPDALFKDPYAAKLAGEQGERIVKQLHRGAQMGWVMVVRTATLDEFVRRAVNEEGVDTVVNLAAGLDTRPYRMDLPPNLRWIEVDLPAITAYKEKMLEGETPRCKLTRIVQDLSDGPGRRELFKKIGSESKKVFVLTEGLLAYLSEDVNAELARDLHAEPKFALWAFDWSTPPVLKFIKKHWGKDLGAANAPIIFAPEKGAEFYTAHGWRVKDNRYTSDEAERLNRRPVMAWLWRLFIWLAPRDKKRAFRRWSGYVLMERA